MWTDHLRGAVMLSGVTTAAASCAVHVALMFTLIAATTTAVIVMYEKRGSQ